MKTKIEAINKLKIKSFENEKLEDIFILDDNVGDFYSSNEISEHIQSYISEHFYEGILCIQAPKITDIELINTLGRLSESDNKRIYLLVGEYTKELDPLVGRVLIRYGIDVHGTLILKNPTSATPSVFFSLNNRNNLNNCFKKEVKVKEIVITLFRHFCYNFWEIAQNEILEKNIPLKVEHKPLDVYHNPNEYGDRDFILSTLFYYKEQTTRGEMAGKIILNNNSFDILKINKKSVVKLPNQKFEELLNKDDFYIFTPILEDDGCSVKIEYNWLNEPYVLPANAKKHSLYDKWKSKEADIQDKLENLFNRAKKINKLDRLKDIQELKKLNFGSDENLPKYIKIINNIHNEISLIEKEELEKKLSAYEEEQWKNEQQQSQLKNESNDLKKKELEDIQKELENKKNTLKKKITNIDNANLNEIPFLEDIKLDLIPKIGQLYEYRNKNFLAISYWEEYDDGLKEALKLNANLCFLSLMM